VTTNDLTALFDYSYWANAKLFEVIADLPDDEFTRNVAGGYGSIRNTLVHMMSAEAGWLERCGGPPRGPKLNADDFPTPQSVATRWRTIEGQMRQFLTVLTDADAARSLEFTIVPGTGPRVMRIDEMLHHAAVHNIHHRGQVALLLRVVGRVPGNFDALFYYLEKAKGDGPLRDARPPTIGATPASGARSGNTPRVFPS
jgi:uncharacterized damage-inducible protein DinB